MCHCSPLCLPGIEGRHIRRLPCLMLLFKQSKRHEGCRYTHINIQIHNGVTGIVNNSRIAPEKLHILAKAHYEFVGFMMSEICKWFDLFSL